MSNFNSSLMLQRLVFDKIEFNRKGFKNTNELNFELQVQIGVSEESVHRVTLVLRGEKEEEYSVEIGLSGFFRIDVQEEVDDKMFQHLMSKNAVAILMPYLRSELTLLTAQPETDSVVLPPFNINKMMKSKKEKADNN